MEVRQNHIKNNIMSEDKKVKEVKPVAKPAAKPAAKPYVDIR